MHNKAHVVTNLIQRRSNVLAKIPAAKIQELPLILKPKNIAVSNVTINDLPLNIYRTNDLLSDSKMLITI